MSRQKDTINVVVAIDNPGFYCVLEGSKSRGEWGGRMGGFVVVLVVVVGIVVVVVVGGGLILWVDLSVPDPPFGVQIGSFNGKFKQFCVCRAKKTLET